jgi:glycerol-3-phosphate acyltransferase PlsX
VVQELILSIDAMGGDGGPEATLAGAALSRRRHPKTRYLLHGDEQVLTPILARNRTLARCAEIRHAPGQIRMEEKPSQALRRGRNTSMWNAVEAVAKGEAGVAISAGNTGALMAISMFRLGLIEGISRPAMDVGANAGSDAQQLVDFAVMGEAFSRAIFGIGRPTVGLLNIGEEEAKGIESVKLAAKILRASKLPIEFCGFVEGDDISKGTVDVIVTDGFTGNIALKTAEGTAKMVLFYFKSALMRSALSRLGAILARGALRTLRRKLDPRTLNGGVFLGLNGVVVKSHGGTDALGFAAALDLAIDMGSSDMIQRIHADHAGISMAAADDPESGVAERTAGNAQVAVP